MVGKSQLPLRRLWRRGADDHAEVVAVAGNCVGKSRVHAPEEGGSFAGGAGDEVFEVARA